MTYLKYEELLAKYCAAEGIEPEIAHQSDGDEDIARYRLIDKRTLLRLVPLSYSTIWKLMRRGEFPLSVVVSGRVFWKISEVSRFVDELPRSKYLGVEEPGNPDRGVGQ